MSSKRRRGEGSSSAPSKPYDKKKFINVEASDRFASLVSKTIVPERGLRPDETQDGDVAVMIAERDWFTLTEQPEPAVIQIVKEFYANAKDHHLSNVYVRGKTVSFHSTEINRYYQLPAAPDDAYGDYVKGGPDYDLIVQQLCQPGTAWKVMDKAAMHIPLSTLSRYGKAWFAFICAKLMPTTHVSDVTKERAVLLHCLVRGLSINVGKVIENSILRAIKQGTRGGLPHPSLICGLCKKAGVKWTPNEPLVPPMPPIDHSLISRYKVWAGGESDLRGLGFIVPPTEPRAVADQPAPPSTAAGTSSLRSNDKVRHWMAAMDAQHDELVRQNQRIAQRQGVMYSYNVNFNTALATMFARMNPNVEPVTFPAPPTLPAYPPSDSDEGEDVDADSTDVNEEVDHDD